MKNFLTEFTATMILTMTVTILPLLLVICLTCTVPFALRVGLGFIKFLSQVYDNFSSRLLDISKVTMAAHHFFFHHNTSPYQNQLTVISSILMTKWTLKTSCNMTIVMMYIIYTFDIKRFVTAPTGFYRDKAFLHKRSVLQAIMSLLLISMISLVPFSTMSMTKSDSVLDEPVVSFKKQDILDERIIYSSIFLHGFCNVIISMFHKHNKDHVIGFSMPSLKHWNRSILKKYWCPGSIKYRNMSRCTKTKKRMSEDKTKRLYLCENEMANSVTIQRITKVAAFLNISMTWSAHQIHRWCVWTMCWVLMIAATVLLSFVRWIERYWLVQQLVLLFVQVVSVECFLFTITRILLIIPWKALICQDIPMMLWVITLACVQKWAAVEGIQLISSRRCSPNNSLYRAYSMATDPLYVVSPEDIASRAREMKTARQRERRKAESLEKKQLRRETNRKYNEEKRRRETADETEARLQAMREYWASAKVKDKHNIKKVRERRNLSHEEIITRNTIRTEIIKSNRLKKRKAETEVETEEKRSSLRLRIQAFRNRQCINLQIGARIRDLMKNALDALHVTNTDSTNKTNRTHKARICIICDCFIKGVHEDGVPSISGREIKCHFNRLSVNSYQEFHKVTLKPKLIEYYEVKGFEGMLLSKNATKLRKDTYPICLECKPQMTKARRESDKPPTYSIANGFAIGCIPKWIEKSKGGVWKIIIDETVNPVMKALMAPVRPYGWIFQHSGGCQKSIIGHYTFFETDQSVITGVANCLKQFNANNIFVMICGSVTHGQKCAILNQSYVDLDMYTDLRRWFIENNEHPSFKGQAMPSDVGVLQPIFIQDSRDSTECASKDAEIENAFGHEYWTFSTAQDPTEDTSVYQTTQKFACALINKTMPKLLVQGGEYAKEHEVEIEAILPFAFPYGLGGPKTKRRAHVPIGDCIQRYFRLAMPQFMAADVILVLHQIYSRQLSFRSGVMTCRGKYRNVNNFVRVLSRMKPSDFDPEKTNGDPTNNPDVSRIVSSITTACKAMGHTAEHAAMARQKQFAMMDLFGMTSLFLTITPDDECSFRVRLYAEPDKEVSNHRTK